MRNAITTVLTHQHSHHVPSKNLQDQKQNVGPTKEPRKNPAVGREGEAMWDLLPQIRLPPPGCNRPPNTGCR